MAQVRALIPAPTNLVPPCPSDAPPFLIEHWEQRHLDAAPMILGSLSNAEQELWRDWTSLLAKRGQGPHPAQIRRLNALLAAIRLARATGAAIGVPAGSDPVRAAFEELHRRAVALCDRLSSELELGAPEGR